MLDINDCIALCGLTEEEVAAIAEHEHVPDVVAAELGNYLIQTEDGVPKIRRMIIEDIDDARRHGNLAHVAVLKLTLKHFVETHGPGGGTAA